MTPVFQYTCASMKLQAEEDEDEVHRRKEKGLVFK
jgi:hypothetical protein